MQVCLTLEFRGFSAASKSDSCIVRVCTCWSLPAFHLMYFMRDTAVRRMAWNQTGWVLNPMSTTEERGTSLSA